MDFSFIIPAYNEAGNIEKTINAIRKYVPGNFESEIIVVDHGSTDDTADIAQACGATSLVHPQGTIAQLRNLGVQHSTGSLLVFLDADIRLTREWQTNITGVAHALIAGDRILTGSWCSVPDDPNWIEKHWFKPLERGDSTHINSGHLIISRKLFDEIGGFDETLETGEDYDISIRAKAENIKLIDNTGLRVVHEGYPRTLFAFAKREYWHGKGDATALSMVLHSKVAVVSLLFLALHLALIYTAVSEDPGAMFILLLSIVTVAVLSAYLKYRDEPFTTISINSAIYYVYFWARGLSVLSLPGLRDMKKRSR